MYRILAEFFSINYPVGLNVISVIFFIFGQYQRCVLYSLVNALLACHFSKSTIFFSHITAVVLKSKMQEKKQNRILYIHEIRYQLFHMCDISCLNTEIYCDAQMSIFLALKTTEKYFKTATRSFFLFSLFFHFLRLFIALEYSKLLSCHQRYSTVSNCRDFGEVQYELIQENVVARNKSAL